MFFKKINNGRIFINYRRSDSQAIAGRLSDSLESYFGDNRVFRDIEDITGGDEFAKTIETNLHAADAMIVLIGPGWLTSANQDGKRRLDRPDDWVVNEIAIAIQKSVRLFPVLIEGTPMPRSNELPDKIATLLNYNTVTISDRNWYADVQGLGKIISLDIPSTNERILYQAKLIISLLLFFSIAFSATIFTLRNFAQLSDNNPLISFGAFGLPFIAISISVVYLFSIKGRVDEERKRYNQYSAWAGAIGTVFSYCIIYPIEPQANEIIALLLGTVFTASLMFVFITMSGFKSK